MPLISIVSPIYKAEGIVDELVKQLTDNLSEITSDFEIILVNDASPDQSWAKIVALSQQDTRVKGINLSRNFGQHKAISAGLSFVKGEWIVVMDCDLQDRPDEIVNLYRKAQEGYRIVQARREERKDGFSKQLSSSIFHCLFSYLSGEKSDRAVANFGVYHRMVIDEYNKMHEASRSFPSLINYLGFSKTTIDVKHSERMEGRSSYTLSKLLNLALDVALSNSNKPLKLTIKLGFTLSAISIVLALYNIIAYFTGIIQVPGYTTTIFSIWLLSGVLIFILGIIGLYIGKIYDEVKGRPLFVVQQTLNITKDGDQEI